MRWLSYPANLAFAGVAAFVLAVPVVTWFAAAIAAGRAMEAWLTDGDDRVFTNTFREFGRTWRRTWLLSLAATGVLVLAVSDWLFLSSQGGGPATVMAAAFLPVAAALLLVGVHLPAAAAAERDAGPRRWLRLAAAFVAIAPLRSVGVLVAVVTWLVLCVTVPTLFPFLGLSVPTFLGLVSARRAHDRVAD